MSSGSTSTIRLRIQSLRLADMVMEGTFFLMQSYLTDVWKLNFTTASAFLNIWGGIYRILPIFFIYLADMYLGNFLTLALSGIFSTTGLFLITASALPVHRCEHKEVADCNGDREKGLFIAGMGLIALGRAARFASAQPFTKQQFDDMPVNRIKLYNMYITTAITAVLVNFAFPYAKKWYLLFGVSAIYTASATVLFLSGYHMYNKYGPTAEEFPITDVYRVFVATAFKISRPFPEDRMQLHGMDGRLESQEFSSPRFLRFLYKAAIKLPHEEAETGEVDRWSWRLCSVSRVEFTITMIRLIPFISSFIMCGVVSSTGNTYFVEQIDHMEYKIGAWEPPAQVLMSLFLLSTLSLGEDRVGRVIGFQSSGYRFYGALAMVCSILCCTVAAAVERRRLHVGRRHDLLDQLHDAKIPMNAGWLLFQIVFLALQEPCMVIALTDFHVRHSPVGLKAFQNCMIEGVSGIGFMCSALVVYAVGKISETGGNPSWFQATLNKSRLDRYYWVLAGLSSVNLLVFVFTTACYGHREWDDEEPEAGVFTEPY